MTTRQEYTSQPITTPINHNQPIGASVLQNGSNDSRSISYLPEYYKDAQIGFLVLLLLFIVIGNLIVLAAIALSKERRRSRMNFFIMHLALCDLLNGPLIVLSDLVAKVTIYWYAGAAFCKLHKFSQVLVMYASTYILVALSIDRLDAVARPLHFTGSGLRIKMLVAIAWALSCVFAVPELVLFNVSTAHGGPLCVIDFTSPVMWQVYMCLIAVSVFFIPALIILVCYVAIIVLIFKSTQLINSVTKKTIHSDGEFLRDGSSRRKRSVQCQSSRGIIPQAKIRTIKMTFIIVFVFILCWSPYFLFNLCDVFGAWPRSLTMMKVTTFIQSLAPLNSAANPIIYGIFSTRVCRYIRRAPVGSRVPTSVRQCCLNNSPTTKGSIAEYTSISEVEDFRSSGESRHSISPSGSGRVPLVQQELSPADQELLYLHVRTNSAADNV